MNLCIHSFLEFFLASSYAYPILSNTVAIVVSKTAAKEWVHTKGNVLGWYLRTGINSRGEAWPRLGLNNLITNVLRMTEYSLVLGVVLLVLVIVIYT